MIFKPDSITYDDFNRLVAVGDKQTMWRDDTPGLVQQLFQCNVYWEAEILKQYLDHAWWVGPDQWVFNRVGFIGQINPNLLEKHNIKQIDVSVALTQSDCTIQLWQSGQQVAVGHCHHLTTIEIYANQGLDWDKQGCAIVAAKFFFDKAEKEFSMPGRVMADLN